MNVMFYSVKLRSTFDAIETKDSLALYWIEETQELFKGDKLFGVGREASAAAAGLLSAEDKAKLDALVAGGGLDNLIPVDGSVVLADVDGGKSIGVAVSAQETNALSVVEDGLFVPMAPEFAIEKQGVAEDGYAATYKLKRTVGGESTYVGDSINIFKDLVLQSAAFEKATEANMPYEGAAIGDPYIHLVFNDASASDIYIPVGELVDIYASGDGISIVDNVISVKIAEESHGLISVDGAMSMLLATRTNDGALSKEDQLVIDSIPSVYEARKYEISSKPIGTLVRYGESEIRVMCPADTEWVKQNVGATGNANMHYMAFKAYAPEGAVSFKEGDQGVIEDEMYTFDDDFAGIDEFGRKYSICWLALASYDADTDSWNYFGKNSSAERYIGWTYVVEWYDADGKIIASDSIRINLSNEDCHSVAVPYYMTGYSTVEELSDVKAAIADMAVSCTWGEM